MESSRLSVNIFTKKEREEKKPVVYDRSANISVSDVRSNDDEFCYINIY